MLVTSEQFRSSEQTIQIAGQRRTTVADFFVPFLKIENTHINRFQGFWGMVTDASVAETGALWLNTGEKGNVSVCIQERSLQQFKVRYKIDDNEQLAGCYALALGTLKRSRAGKAYLLPPLCMLALYFD